MKNKILSSAVALAFVAAVGTAVTDFARGADSHEDHIPESPLVVEKGAYCSVALNEDGSLNGAKVVTGEGKLLWRFDGYGSILRQFNGDAMSVRRGERPEREGSFEVRSMTDCVVTLKEPHAFPIQDIQVVSPVPAPTLALK